MTFELKSVLLAGLIAVSVTACSKDLPTGPAQDGGKGQSGVSARLRPANDDFDDAVVITELPFTDRVNTSAARTSHDDPLNDESCGFGSVCGHTVWYQFTPTQDMRVNASTSGSDGRAYGTIAERADCPGSGGNPEFAVLGSPSTSSA